MAIRSHNTHCCYSFPSFSPAVSSLNIPGWPEIDWLPHCPRGHPLSRCWARDGDTDTERVFMKCNVVRDTNFKLGAYFCVTPCIIIVAVTCCVHTGDQASCAVWHPQVPHLSHHVRSGWCSFKLLWCSNQLWTFIQLLVLLQACNYWTWEIIAMIDYDYRVMTLSIMK